MPNHVTTYLRSADRSAIHALLTEGGVDFSRIIPEPADLMDRPDARGTFGPMPAWYVWRVDHWGTKWNAYDDEVNEHEDHIEVRFDTAWAHPFPVIEELSRRFPQARIEVEYADEDLGENCGQYFIVNGECESAPLESGTPEALEFAAQIRHGRSYAELRAEWGDDD